MNLEDIGDKYYAEIIGGSHGLVKKNKQKENSNLTMEIRFNKTTDRDWF